MEPPRVRRAMHILCEKSNVSPSRKQSLKNARNREPRRQLVNGSWQTFALVLPVDGRGNRVWSRKKLRRTVPRLGGWAQRARVVKSRAKSSPFCKTGVTAKSTFARSACFALLPKKLVLFLMSPQADGGPRDRPDLRALRPFCAFVCIWGVRTSAQGTARRGAPKKRHKTSA